MPTLDTTAGQVGSIGVTILAADGSVHVARTTAGITEVAAGTYFVADHATDVRLGYRWDFGGITSTDWRDPVPTFSGTVNVAAPIVPAPIVTTDTSTIEALIAAIPAPVVNVPTPTFTGTVSAPAFAGTVNAPAVNTDALATALAPLMPTPIVTGGGALTSEQAAHLMAIPTTGGSQPTEGITITPLTKGTDGAPLGRVMPYGTVKVYLGNVARYQFDADADGDYTYILPVGSVWRLVAKHPLYVDCFGEVSTVPAP